MFKRLSAIFIALIMCLSLMTPAFAEGDDTSDNTTGTIQVINAGKGSTVMAYQIIEAATDNNGNFLGWKFTAAVPSNVIQDKWTTTINGQTLIKTVEGAVVLTQNDFITIINAVTKDKKYEIQLTSTPANDADSTTYQATGMTPGAYAVFVTPAADALMIYNPMIVSVNYDSNGQVEQLKSVDASQGFDITGYAYAKSSAIEVKKKANTDNASLGQTVTYTVENNIPDYNETYYDSVIYNFTDQLSPGLNYVLNNDGTVDVQVQLNDVDVDSTKYTVTWTAAKTEGDKSTPESLLVEFDSNFILEAGSLATKKLTLTYNATINENATTGFDPNTNTVTLEYTNKPGLDENNNPYTGTTDDEFDEYTFSINGSITSNTKLIEENTQINFIKTGENETTTSSTVETKYHPLNGATFALYDNAECSGTPLRTATTGEEGSPDGMFVMNQLAAGTYWLKETSAPTGYALNATPIKVEITAQITNDVLEWYKVAIGNEGEVQSTTYTATFNGGVITNITTTTSPSPDEGGYYEFINLTVSGLPSTGSYGTYAFILVGCIIMATALTMFVVKRKESK